MTQNSQLDLLQTAQRSALQLLDGVMLRKAEFGRSGDLGNRAAEFLLLLRRLSAEVQLPVGRLLEVGCGGGLSLRLWSEVADNVTGIDLPSAIADARRLLAAFPPRRDNVTLLEGRAEDLLGHAQYDLIVSQYVLEHVDDLQGSLERMRDSLKPEGVAVHVLNNTVSRATWYIQYRSQLKLVPRLRESIREHGLGNTLSNPAAHTPPHEPRFGSFDYELDQYRLDRWALQLMRAGFLVTEWFQTSDINYVFVTRKALIHDDPD